MKLSYVHRLFISCSLPVIAVGTNPLSIRGGAGEASPSTTEHSISDKISHDRYLEDSESTLSIQLENGSGNNTGTERSDDPEPLVINGKNARPGRYPYYAVSQPWGCGGTLVGKRAILTAAHCVRTLFKGRVEVGLTTWRDKSGQIIPIQKVIPHPKFNPNTYDYDYAIVILRKATKHKPVCLAKKNFKRNWAKKSLRVMGFGSTRSYRVDQKSKDIKGRAATSKLQYANVNQVSLGSCKARYRGEYISPRMMCTLGPNNRDACQGDSGGPLIKPGRNAADDVLVGVVSWGIGCGTNPGVYSDVGEALVWILQMIKQNKGGPIANPKECLKALRAK
eukprot:CAMPEP_0194297916 /NCGR_PEP_ID=MMETSP0169-20130528/59877_1 /TAXON_ID=218684 /ORGANISM="Corethron pennatum, Strain L29A3" /LENGTH=335 /DNA_ID=CAMNT_0039047845 /DNA_START=477 /DNA_END=1484 /DNA_ORIENTATION=+